MTDSDSDFLCGGVLLTPPPPSEDDSDDDGFAVSGAPQIACPSRKRRRVAFRPQKAPLQLSPAVPICAFLVIDCAVSTPYYFQCMFAKSRDALPHYSGAGIELAIIGLVILTYCMRPATEHAPTEDLSALESASRRKRRGITGGIFGLHRLRGEGVLLARRTFPFARQG